ncbi:MAG: chemotaxis response regulator protein-glutamate methylesterase [Desulfobulbaceae bacterium A2]|uniref:Protein-glutamate methylesterase/protein-glutamine glutaminase n=1 Tax=Rhodoferax ferrireducens TaxID=192843 RepID=A0A1W9KPA7_9BURK|nr:MAG: chemotaxis response regulator protein-glutamate methylesterase [Rhodoferax ferrireducens]OQX18516.1 MAG: chemotaxis response regulator protein-glutamate methylesterase [Desulfobulbaceae bacterium A2]
MTTPHSAISTPNSPIRVLLVDDSPIALHILQRLLSGMPDIQVAGTAANGKEALELIPTLNPDVICTDLHMPVMDGLEFTRAVMNKYPRPILVVSVSVEPDSPNIFRLLEAGALDIYAKPHDILGADQDKLARELASRIRILAGVHVFRRTATAKTTPPTLPPLRLTPHANVRIVAIGASTGGPQALREILSRLPASFPVPVMCVQHIGSDFLTGLVNWLAEACPLTVRKAVQGELPCAGMVYFAPEDTHLELDDGGRFSLSLAPPCDGHRPSATVALRAAARRYGAGTVGVLLTGMGRDGAEGMAEIAAAGGATIAQDETSSVVYGMPKAAVELGAAQHVLPLDHIAPALVALVKGNAE